MRGFSHTNLVLWLQPSVENAFPERLVQTPNEFVAQRLAERAANKADFLAKD
jgi:hypothetical protein